MRLKKNLNLVKHVSLQEITLDCLLFMLVFCCQVTVSKRQDLTIVIKASSEARSLISDLIQGEGGAVSL